MRLLVLGHSRIVGRRLLPALDSVPEVERVDIGSLRAPEAARAAVAGMMAATSGGGARRAPGELFAGYDQALERSSAELAWVSVVNSAHADLVERCLRRGLHVVVEKPATTRLADAERLLELARRQGRCLAEATVFAWHPRITLIHDAFASRDDRPIRLAATFSMPPLEASDFRSSPELGGGALLDLGPYAVASARLFFGEPASEVSCRVVSRGATGIDTAFALIATFGGERAMIGHFGFGTQYRNRLDLIGRRVAVTIDRVFSTPPDFTDAIDVVEGDRQQSVTAPAADTFALFLRDVIASIGDGSHPRWGELLRADAVALHALRAAAGERER